jgi:phosphoserine aminotransferase
MKIVIIKWNLLQVGDFEELGPLVLAFVFRVKTPEEPVLGSQTQLRALLRVPFMHEVFSVAGNYKNCVSFVLRNLVKHSESMRIGLYSLPVLAFHG